MTRYFRGTSPIGEIIFHPDRVRMHLDKDCKTIVMAIRQKKGTLIDKGRMSLF